MMLRLQKHPDGKPSYSAEHWCCARDLKLCAFRLLVIDKQGDYTISLDVLSLLQ